MRTRNKQIVFNLNNKEYEHFQNQLVISGLTKSKYLRRLILQQNIKPRLPKEYAKVVYEISKIGSNINQIAHRSNASRFLSQEDAKTAKLLMQKYWEEVRNLK